MLQEVQGRCAGAAAAPARHDSAACRSEEEQCSTAVQQYNSTLACCLTFLKSRIFSRGQRLMTYILRAGRKGSSAQTAVVWLSHTMRRCTESRGQVVGLELACTALVRLRSALH
jgi:hypothetical protein